MSWLASPKLLWETWRTQAWELLGVAALASLPPELYCEAKHWDALDPAANLLQLLWYPLSIYAELRLLSLLGRQLRPESERPAIDSSAVGRALSAELLFGLRFCSVLMLWALPALFALSIFGLSDPLSLLLILLLALGGSIPMMDYLLRRFFSAPIVLWQGLNGAAALDESVRICQGKLKALLPHLLLWGLIATLLDNAGGLSLPLTLLALPLAFALNCSILAVCYHILTL